MKKIKTIVSGIAQNYQSEELVGRKIIVVTNLKPVKLRGGFIGRNAFDSLQ